MGKADHVNPPMSTRPTKLGHCVAGNPRMNSKFRLEMWREEQNVRSFHPSVCSRKYATLEENEQQEETKEGEKTKRKRKYKRYKKNVRKALSYSWKCLLLGLQNCTAGYYAPNITATFAHEFSNSSDKTRPNHL